jgi:hypothetical protein
MNIEALKKKILRNTSEDFSTLSRHDLSFRLCLSQAEQRVAKNKKIKKGKYNGKYRLYRGVLKGL